MSRGRRYSNEGELNYTKVFAVLIAVIVIIMGIFILKNALSKGNENYKEESKAVDYFALYANNKWGILDSNGNTVIEPMYQEMIIVLNNKKDVFLCTYDVDENTGEYKTKIINKENKEIYTDYSNIEPLANYDKNGNMWYEADVFKVKIDGKYGLIDIDGNEILSAQYDDIQTLKGLKNSLIVEKDGKYGLVNTSGVTIVAAEYKNIKGFDEDYSHGYIIIDENDKYGLVSSAGSTILKNEFEKIDQIYGENYFVIEQDGDQKVINVAGEVVLEKGFDKITQINSDGVVFVKDKEYGFMDFDGNTIIDPQYEDLEEMTLGTLKAKKDGKYGIINLENEEKTKFNYNDLYYQKSAGFYVAEAKNYNSDLIDTEFNVKLTGVVSELNTDKGYMKIKINDEYKYYNFKFEEKDVTEVLSSNTLFVSKKDDKYGFVDKDGNVVVDYIYDEAQEQNSYGYASIKKDNLWGAIDSKGNVVLEPKYKLGNNLVIDFIGKWHLGQDLNMNYYCDK